MTDEFTARIEELQDWYNKKGFHKENITAKLEGMKEALDAVEKKAYKLYEKMRVKHYVDGQIVISEDDVFDILDEFDREIRAWKEKL